MKKIRITKNWYIPAIVIAAGILVYILYTFVIFPKAESWILAQIPRGAAVQKALKSQFPEYKVSLLANRSYGAGNQKQLALTVGMSGKKFLTPNQLVEADNTICSTLGKDTQLYNTISIQNSVMHQYIVFYFSQSHPHTVRCT